MSFFETKLNWLKIDSFLDHISKNRKVTKDFMFTIDYKEKREKQSKYLLFK